MTTYGLAVANCRNLPLADNSVDMIFTDPPYLKKYLPVYGWLAEEAARVLKPGGFVLAYCGGMYMDKIYAAFAPWPELQFFWEFAENRPSNRGDFIMNRRVLSIHKPIIAFSKGRGQLRVGGIHSRFESIGKMKLYHAWGQDVSTARYYIDHCTKPGDIVLDPFVGGGSTVEACKLIGRHCIGLDVDLSVVHISSSRMAGAYLPQQATLFAL